MLRVNVIANHLSNALARRIRMITLVNDYQFVQTVIIDKVWFVYSGVSRDSVKEYIHYVMTKLMQHGFEQ